MTVKVKLLDSMASADKSWVPGDVYETSAEEAQALIAAGRAELLTERKLERAVAAPAKAEKRAKGR